MGPCAVPSGAVRTSLTTPIAAGFTAEPMGRKFLRELDVKKCLPTSWQKNRQSRRVAHVAAHKTSSTELAQDPNDRHSDFSEYLAVDPDQLKPNEHTKSAAITPVTSSRSLATCPSSAGHYQTTANSVCSMHVHVNTLWLSCSRTARDSHNQMWFTHLYDAMNAGKCWECLGAGETYRRLPRGFWHL